VHNADVQNESARTSCGALYANGSGERACIMIYYVMFASTIFCVSFVRFAKNVCRQKLRLNDDDAKTFAVFVVTPDNERVLQSDDHPLVRAHSIASFRSLDLSICS
jgi:hypothetical protein